MEARIESHAFKRLSARTFEERGKCVFPSCVQANKACQCIRFTCPAAGCPGPFTCLRNTDATTHPGACTTGAFFSKFQCFPRLFVLILF